MNELPPDAKAIHQGIVITLLAFIIGTVGFFVLVAWLFLRMSGPGLEWFGILRIVMHATWISVLGGMAMAAAATVLHTRWCFRKGFFCCPYCDKPRKRMGVDCDYPGFQAFKADCKQTGPHA